MINLLPTSVRHDVAYGRRNYHLLRYCLVLCGAMVGMLIIVLAGILYMRSEKQAYEQQIDQTKQSLQSQQLSEVQKEAEQISGNIKLATNVLSRQIQFSKLIKAIGATMPDNSSLSDLKINKDDPGMTLTAIAKNYDSASQVQINLADPANKIFSKADLVSISCDDTANSAYPCTVVLRALFADNSSYLFIPPKKDNAR